MLILMNRGGRSAAEYPATHASRLVRLHQRDRGWADVQERAHEGAKLADFKASSTPLGEGIFAGLRYSCVADTW